MRITSFIVLIIMKLNKHDFNLDMGKDQVGAQMLL